LYERKAPGTTDPPKRYAQYACSTRLLFVAPFLFELEGLVRSHVCLHFFTSSIFTAWNKLRDLVDDIDDNQLQTQHSGRWSVKSQLGWSIHTGATDETRHRNFKTIFREAAKWAGPVDVGHWRNNRVLGILPFSLKWHKAIKPWQNKVDDLVAILLSLSYEECEMLYYRLGGKMNPERYEGRDELERFAAFGW